MGVRRIFAEIEFSPGGLEEWLEAEVNGEAVEALEGWDVLLARAIDQGEEPEYEDIAVEEIFDAFDEDEDGEVEWDSDEGLFHLDITLPEDDYLIEARPIVAALTAAVDFGGSGIIEMISVRFDDDDPFHLRLRLEEGEIEEEEMTDADVRERLAELDDDEE